MKYAFLHKDKILLDVYEYTGGNIYSQYNLYIGTLQDAVKLFKLQKIDYSLLSERGLI
jgi:hypothetical protein